MKPVTSAALASIIANLPLSPPTPNLMIALT